MAKLLFFGNERLATGLATTAPVLQALLAAGYEVAAVVVAQKPAGQSRKARPLEIEAVAAAHDIPVIAPQNLKESLDDIKQYQAEAAVLVAYGKIVPQEVIDVFPRGIINIHPSLLPRHRGPTPVESVIRNGELETGVSLMQLVAEMDAGPVYVQQNVALTGLETKADLASQLITIGTQLLIQHLPAILDGSLQPKPQDDSKATYDHLIDKSAGTIDWHKPADEIVREIRAYSDWPRSSAKIGTTDVVITQARATLGTGLPGTLRLEAKSLSVYAKEGSVTIDRLILAGKKEMTAEAFLAGYKPN